MRETRYKAQTDSKNSTLSLLEARVAESEKARKDHEEKTKLKIEALEQVSITPSPFTPLILVLGWSSFIYLPYVRAYAGECCPGFESCLEKIG
jgi:hypothetical protein